MRRTKVVTVGRTDALAEEVVGGGSDGYACRRCRCDGEVGVVQLIAVYVGHGSVQLRYVSITCEIDEHIIVDATTWLARNRRRTVSPPVNVICCLAHTWRRRRIASNGAGYRSRVRGVIASRELWCRQEASIRSGPLRGSNGYRVRHLGQASVKVVEVGVRVHGLGKLVECVSLSGRGRVV